RQPTTNAIDTSHLAIIAQQTTHRFG
ncbi:MAG: hypothetical protein QOJ61_580, partial [Mycobacterium sp.]|nr:hypothetical protein [Mycobacterium sp.]